MKKQQKRNSARNQKRQQRKDRRRQQRFEQRLRDKVNEYEQIDLTLMIDDLKEKLGSDFVNDRHNRLQQAIARGDKIVDFDHVEKNRVYYGNLVRLGCKQVKVMKYDDLFRDALNEFLLKMHFFNEILRTRNQLIDWEAIVRHNNEQYEYPLIIGGDAHRVYFQYSLGDPNYCDADAIKFEEQRYDDQDLIYIKEIFDIITQEMNEELYDARMARVFDDYDRLKATRNSINENYLFTWQEGILYKQGTMESPVLDAICEAGVENNQLIHDQRYPQRVA